MRNIRQLAQAFAVVALVAAGVCATAKAAAQQSLKDKVVLANPDRYTVNVRFGTTQRQIAPRKASVLSPKRFPLTIEYWGGNKTIGWQKVNVPAAGVYDFRWNGAQWSLTRRRPSATATRAYRPASPTYRRSTGSYQRVTRGPTYVRRGPTYVSRGPTYVRGWTGSRWPFWVRGVWGIGKLYQFIRDEQDRDLIRDIIIGREIDDTIRREIEDRLRDDLIALPHDQRQELERAIDDVSRLNPDDWKEISTLPADDWDRLRDEIGENISDADWEGLGGYVDTMDEPIGEDIDLDEAGVETMDWDVDLGDLADHYEDAGDMGADYGPEIEDVDLGDVAGEAETMDLSDFDDGGYHAEPMDDAGGFDIDPGDYDAGGFDDWGDASGFDDGGFDDGGGDMDFGGGFDDFGFCRASSGGRTEIALAPAPGVHAGA